MPEKYSELECLVLGVVWKKGPCTPHAVRVEFKGSRSLHFSGSAGAIYPLVKRLEEKGLLSSREDDSTRQRKRLYRITPSGRAALLSWVMPPFEREVFTVQYDPIRTRLYFLGALPEIDRLGFLDAAEVGFRAELELLARTRSTYAAKDWRFSVLATDGIIMQMKAELDWLASVRRAIEEGEVGSHGKG